MKHVVATFALATALVIASSDAQAKLRVVTTVPDLAALAKDVGGDHVQVKALSLHTQDPHFVDAKPSLILEVNKADLLVAVGLDLEIGWLPTLQTGARNGRVQTGGDGYLECAQVVRVLEIPTGKIDRTMGDVHAGGNPHYLHDPRQAKACAASIAARMMALDPAHAADYRANLERFTDRLDRKIAEWEQRMKPYRGTSVVTYHKSWSYLIDWLGLRRVDTLEPTPGIAPNPRHLAKVIRAARVSKARVLFQETYYPSRTARLVANKIGAKLVTLPAATNYRSGEAYTDHIDDIVTALEGALR